MRILTGGESLESLTYEQFQLSRHANISLSESSLLPEFEREAYVNMLLREMRKEVEAMSSTSRR